MPTWLEIQCEFELNGHTRDELAPSPIRFRRFRSLSDQEEHDRQRSKQSFTISSVDPKWLKVWMGRLILNGPIFIFQKYDIINSN